MDLDERNKGRNVVSDKDKGERQPKRLRPSVNIILSPHLCFFSCVYGVYSEIFSVYLHIHKHLAVKVLCGDSVAETPLCRSHVNVT